MRRPTREVQPRVSRPVQRRAGTSFSTRVCSVRFPGASITSQTAGHWNERLHSHYILGCTTGLLPLLILSRFSCWPVSVLILLSLSPSLARHSYIKTTFELYILKVPNARVNEWLHSFILFTGKLWESRTAFIVFSPP